MRWDERFAGEDYLFGTDPAAALVRHSHRLHAKGKTLVVADGEGRNSTYLAGLGFDVVATDFSPVGLAKARKLAVKRGVTVDYRLADIHATDWTAEAFDNVVAIFIQFVEPDHMQTVFDGLKTALRPGGRLLLHGYTPEQVAFGTGGPPNPDHMYTEALLAEAFSDMTPLVNAAYHAEISEGSGHSGLSALVDFVAEKAL